eukprot:295953-Chlamydomonas_euryale.AAC.1
MATASRPLSLSPGAGHSKCCRPGIFATLAPSPPPWAGARGGDVANSASVQRVAVAAAPRTTAAPPELGVQPQAGGRVVQAIALRRAARRRRETGCTPAVRGAAPVGTPT